MTPAAAKHSTAVTVELVAPVAVIVLSIVKLQVTSNPAPVGKSGGSHWVSADPVSTACTTNAPAPSRALLEERLVGPRGSAGTAPEGKPEGHEHPENRQRDRQKTHPGS